jgi:phospholipid/cholesterol/gamma-HCH transport system ATP-binding protein
VSSLPERQLHTVRARLPYLVQGPALLDWMTVEANVRLAAPGHDSARARHALERLGLWDWKDRFPSELGPAGKKRVAIARALSLDQVCLLLDEPTTGLDRVAARKVNDTLAQLKTQNLGAIIVSHDYRALEALADNVLVIARGQAVFWGTREAFFSSRDPEVRALTQAGLKGSLDG